MLQDMTLHKLYLVVNKEKNEEVLNLRVRLDLVGAWRVFMVKIC